MILLFVESSSIYAAITKGLLDLITYFRDNDLPPADGQVFNLPEGLLFPLDTKKANKRMLIVRKCYERILSVANNLLEKEEQGVIFTGPQGNSKVF